MCRISRFLAVLTLLAFPPLASGNVKNHHLTVSFYNDDRQPVSVSVNGERACDMAPGEHCRWDNSHANPQRYYAVHFRKEDGSYLDDHVDAERTRQQCPGPLGTEVVYAFSDGESVYFGCHRSTHD